MNWNWACEQMLKGKIVYMANCKNITYWVCPTLFPQTKVSGRLHRDLNGKVELYSPSIFDMQAADWELYQEPKKWTEEDIRKAKHGILLGFKWVARDADGVLCWYKTKPTRYNGILKGDGSWCPSQRISSNYDYINNHLFYSVKWEDEEPTPLKDIANSEVQNDIR